MRDEERRKGQGVAEQGYRTHEKQGPYAISRWPHGATPGPGHVLGCLASLVGVPWCARFDQKPPGTREAL